MRFKAGTEVLIKAVIIRDCYDNKPLEERGYIVKTSRGMSMVWPDEVIFAESNKESFTIAGGEGLAY